jgi:hypothetical protein
LEPILQAVEPQVRLIPERYLLQVLEFLLDAGRPLPQNPNLPLWITRDDLVEIGVLPQSMMTGSEPTLLLITDPYDRGLSSLPQPEQLLAYWRVLFQAAVMQRIDQRAEAGILTVENCREKLARFGSHVEREIEFVLLSEHMAHQDANPIALYRSFAATSLDLSAFEKHRVEEFFPSIPGEGAVDHLLADDVDSSALLAASRPAGAASPFLEVAPDERWTTPDTSIIAPKIAPSETGGLRKRAQEAEKKGNYVRAAIVYTQIAAITTGDDQERVRSSALSALSNVVNSLGDLFKWDDDTRQEWRQALIPLLATAATGVWPRAARCLYELQKIPTDLSREVYAVDLPEAIRTFGRRPVKRLLPHARPVLILMHLKKAHKQMLRVGLGHGVQLRVDRLFHHQMHTIEEAIRQEFTPIIADALSRAGLIPVTTVEMVGRDKLVAELLDRICERGYLRLGDVRDAIARNRLKMPDLAGVGEFLRGDGLLRADIELSYALDGIYRKGEFYLRVIQRFSALFFGTKLGRLITIFIAIPFGGAFLALMFAEEVHHIGGKLVSAIARTAPKPVSVNQPPLAAIEPTAPSADIIQSHQVEIDPASGEIVWYPSDVVTSDEVELTEGGELIWYDSPAGSALAGKLFTPLAKTTPHKHHEGSVLIAWPTIVGLGLILLLMIHVSPFRQVVFKILGYVWWVVRGILWDIPIGVWRSSTVRGFRQSYSVRFLVRHFWSPSLITILLFGAMFLVGVSPWFLLKWGWAIWACLTLAYNTPWGWVIQDRIAEAISDWWRIVRTNLIPGLLGTIIDWFRLLGNWIERQLYAVDEWLRFRSGDSHASLALKAILGLLWFPLAYTFRFVFYLLVEPQINPVKHFPVVTVSHKVIWPMVPQIAESTGLSPWTVGMFVNGVPGIFGFIAWELKENWRLYKANLPARLKPVMIGSHGETMRGLLRPGFHSGTVPKLFRKLRHAAQAKASRLLHDLDHLAEAVDQFAAREFVDLIGQCPEWGKIAFHVSGIRFGCQRLVIDFAATGLGHDLFTVAFEHVSGQIEAVVEQTGWVDKLTDHQRATFVAALRGLLDMAAVQTINGRPRVEGAMPLGPGFDDLARTLTWTEWVERWNSSSTRG